MKKSEGNVLSNQMGSSFNNLSPLLKQVHTGKQTMTGIINIERGNIFARIICTVFRFPKANDACTLTVECQHTPNNMVWIRDFEGHCMKSSFTSNKTHMIEKLGPLDLIFSPDEENGSLNYNFHSTKLFGIPLPKLFAPIIHAREYEEDGKYTFEVSVRMHLIGLVLSYGGSMTLIETHYD